MSLSSTFASLHQLMSPAGCDELRTEFLSGASAVDIGYGKTLYDATEDALVGYYTNLEEECGPVGHFDFVLPYSEFIGNRVVLAGVDIVGRFEDDLVKHGPKGAGHVRRLYEAEISRCEAVALAEYDDRSNKTIQDALRELLRELERVERAFRLPVVATSSVPVNKGGRPFDKSADQGLIRETVWKLALEKRCQRSDGTLKPTTIRDMLQKVYPDVCGDLGDRALFDRVKQALSAGPPQG